MLDDHQRKLLDLQLINTTNSDIAAYGDYPLPYPSDVNETDILLELEDSLNIQSDDIRSRVTQNLISGVADIDTLISSRQSHWEKSNLPPDSGVMPGMSN